MNKRMVLLVGLSMAAVAVAALPTRALAQQVGYVNFIAAGLPDPNGKVPTFNAVPGAGVGNVDIATPTAVLTHGQIYTYLVSSQNNTYNGNCTDEFELTQVQGGKTVKLDSGKISAYACGPGQFWAWGTNGVAVPNSPGPAKLVGLVKFGTISVKVTLPVLIQ